MRLVAVALLTLAPSAGCGGPFVRQYEYEEQIYLDTDGSAEIVVNASIAALVALRGAPLNVDPRARVDREKVRAFFTSPVTRVTRVSRAWRRGGRPFIGVRIDVDDIGRLAEAPAFAWATYALNVTGPEARYTQVVGSPGDRPAPAVWRGDELVAFRLHLPSEVVFHNARSVEDDTPVEVERGNIVSWEQRLANRLRGEPVTIEVRMGARSILNRTLWLFGLSFGAAMMALGAFVWWLRRGGAPEEQGGDDPRRPA